MIVNDIEKNFEGFQGVNELCIRNLRESLIEKSCEFADDEIRGEFTSKNEDRVTFEKALKVLKNVGTFLRHQGKFEKSVKYLMNAKQIMEDRYCDLTEQKDDDKEGKDCDEPPPLVRSWSAMQLGVGKKIEKEEERKETLELWLSLLNSLANGLTADKDFDEAEKIYRKILKWRRDLLSTQSKDTKMTQFNLGVCLIRQDKFLEAEKLLNGSLDQWTKDVKYHYYAMFNLADLKSKDGRPEQAEKDFHDACAGLLACNVGQRDRFLSLANVLWAKHLLRHADKKLGQEKITLLETALEKVNFAYNNFCVNSDLSHPDTRLAARTRRSLDLKLHPKLLDQEKERRKWYIEKCTYKRKWNPETNTAELTATNKIRVMHWNILADKLAYPDLKEGAFGCSYELLDWKKERKDKICAEILKYDPDVLILVELDHYEDIRFLLQEDYGYDSVWKKKFASFYADGTAIFWKRKRLQAGKIYKKELRKEGGEVSDEVLVAVELKSESNFFPPFVAAGCHLTSEKKSPGEYLRLNQCKQILNILNFEFAKHPIILGADLNSECQYKDYNALAYPYIVNSGLVSSYANVRRKEPDFTSWKFRIDEDIRVSKAKKINKVVDEFKYTIDYIFHSKELTSLAVLEMPEEKEIDNYDFAEIDIEDEDKEQVRRAKIRRAKRRCLLPNDRCASDHLSLVAEILLPQV